MIDLERAMLNGIYGGIYGFAWVCGFAGAAALVVFVVGMLYGIAGRLLGRHERGEDDD